MTLYDLLTLSANRAIHFQAPDGSMPPGHNGPYRDPETPVRNTAHWLLTWLKVFELTGESKYRQAADMAATYLTSRSVRPMQATFWCRRNPYKDYANGLIGQAWVIEALVTAGRTLVREDLLDLAQEVFLLHPYDAAAGGWRKVHVDGSFGPLDQTFNHQLWFAAAGSLLNSVRSETEISERVQHFLGQLGRHIAIHKSGLVRHSGPTFLAVSSKRKLWGVLRNISKWNERAHMHMKSVGYHSFNLYGFAILKSAYPQHEIWRSPKIRSALGYAASESYWKKLETNTYGYPYNPPGFEVPYAFQVFGIESFDFRRRLVKMQIRRSFDFENNLMRRGTEDETTLAARLYEATRLQDCRVQTEGTVQ